MKTKSHHMRISMVFLSFVLSGVCAAGLMGQTTDWPQWRGPNRTGIAQGENLLSAWPDGGPPLVWNNRGVGKGYSSLAVQGKSIITMGDLGDNQYVIAVKRDDGSALWKTDVGPAHYGGTRCTPTIDQGRVYCVTTEGVLVCLDLNDGSIIWKSDLVSQFKGFVAQGAKFQWKFSESPLVDGDKVLVTPGSTNALIIALNKATGALIWRTAQPEMGPRGADGTAYSSLVISHALGVKQYVTLTGRGAVGVSASDGQFLWGYNPIANDVANVPTPIVFGDHVFVSTGYGTGAALLKIVREGDKMEAREVYFLDAKSMQNHHGGMIRYQDHIFAGSGHGKGFPICIDAQTGETKWGPIRNKGTGSAAITLADGHLYFRYQDGRMVLVEASADQYTEKGTFMIPDVQENSWSHPVIAGGYLYLREQDQLYCYDLRTN